MSGGAVAYLAQSSYGRNRTEITINDYYTNERTENPYKTAITGLASSDGSESMTQDLSNVAAYNTTNGMKGSSTGNITGVYDLSGGLWERVSGYILNGNSQLTSNGTNSTYGSSGALMGITSESNPNGYLTLSTREYTVYPYNSVNDVETNNYTTYKGLLSSTYGYGDALLETSSSGSDTNGWNLDYSRFVCAANPFFIRGGACDISSYTGPFAFDRALGGANYNSGFRTVLITE